MPLPPAPEQKPYRGKNSDSLRTTPGKVDNELLFKGILCMLIGLGVLLSPYFITSPGMQNIVAQSALVGWFALVLGLGFTAVYLRKWLATRKT